MPRETAPGKPTTRRYTPEEKAQAVRLVRELRRELNFTVLPIIVGSGVRLFQDMDIPAGHVGLKLRPALDPL